MAGTEDYVPMYTVGHVLQQKYRLEQILGIGSFAEVWLATDLADNSQVAIKIMRRDITSRTTIDRFRAEKDVALKLSKGPHIVAARVYLREEGLEAIVLEYIEGGETLRHRLERATPSCREALRMLTDILRGLVAAHAIGVIHRDLKPENVLLNSKTSPVMAMLTDFGIAFVSGGGDARKTREGLKMGTPAYIAPEQWVGATLATPRSDLFSVGVMLAELVGVSPLVTEMNVEVMLDPEKINVWLGQISDSRIRAIVKMATEIEFIDGRVVERRYSSAAEMLRVVETLMAEMPSDEPTWTDREPEEVVRVVAPDENLVPPADEAEPPRGNPFETFVDSNAAPPPEPDSIPPPRSRGKRRWVVVAMVIALISGGIMTLWPKEKVVPIVVETPALVKAKAETKVEEPLPVTPEAIEEPKAETPEVPIVLVVEPVVEPKLEVPIEVKTEIEPKVEVKPKVEPVKPKIEAPKAEVRIAVPVVTELKIVIVNPPAQAKAGETITVSASIVLPEGSMVGSATVRYRGEAGGAWQSKPVNIEKGKATANIMVTATMGAKVEYYIDVRLADAPGKARKSAVATTAIVQ